MPSVPTSNASTGCGCGREPHLGLRREAERHAAFERPDGSTNPKNFLTPESGVAAAALLPQSKTSRNYPAASQISAALFLKELYSAISFFIHSFGFVIQSR
jgi:hypothetical protein